MSHLANDTLPLDAPVARGAAGDDLSQHMMHIVRRAVRRAGSPTTLSRAIRSAVGSDEDEARERFVANRIGTLLAERLSAPPGRLAHRETVRA